MFKTSLAYDNWKNKYRYGDETPIDTFKRIAKALASVEKNPDEWYPKFINTLLKLNGETDAEGLKCTMGGRITANIGTNYKNATLLNCFVTGPVSGATIKYKRKSDDGSISHDIKIQSKDDPDDLINIFLTILEQAKTLAAEGGYGINFDFIRPRGALIKGTGIKHPGIVAYMKVWDTVSDCIVRGVNDGYVDKLKNYLKPEEMIQIEQVVKTMTRKGAMMGCLTCSHPDIEEFVKAKQSSGVLTKFNISVLMTDEFLEAVQKDDFFNLHFKGTIYKRVKARELYDLIMESCYHRNEPGVLYYDNMQKNNPVSYLGKVNTVNPCGEVPGMPSLTTVCLLGSINLTMYVLSHDKTNNKKYEKPIFDWDQYEEDIKIFTRMLDNVNDLTYHTLPSYQWVTQNLRQFGMGINGLGSTLAMLGVAYNSKEALDFADKINDIKENITWQTSAYLAYEKGVFPLYDKKQFENTEFFKSNQLSEDTKNIIRKYGVRNAKTTTNPPLGNSSVICSNTSNGIEPIFALEYERIVICDIWPEGINSDNVKKKLKHYKEKEYEYWRGDYDGKTYYYEENNRGLCTVEVIRDYGYQWLLDNYPDAPFTKNILTARQLTIDEHINMQAVIQRHVNQSISKTCNLPKDYSFEDFRELYLKAWKKGLNGFTTYREGSMESVMQEFEKASENKNIIARDIQLPEEFLNGPTKIIKKEGLKFYIHFSYLPDDPNMEYPIVMWIYTNAKYKGESLRICNKASRNLAKLAKEHGIDIDIIQDAVEKAKIDYPHNRLGRMVSLCLRHKIPREAILVALMNIDGDNISTLLTAVRKFLSETLPDGTKLEGVLCENPDCTGTRTNIVLESGCKTCRDCGWSGCG